MIRTYFLTGLLVMSLIYVIESCIGRRRMLIGTSITDIFYNNNQNAVFLFCIQFYMVIIISRILFWSYEQNSPLKNRTIFEGKWHIKTICQFSACLRKFLVSKYHFFRRLHQINFRWMVVWSSVSFKCPQWDFLENSLGLLLLCNGQ